MLGVFACAGAKVDGDAVTSVTGSVGPRSRRGRSEAGHLTGDPRQHRRVEERRTSATVKEGYRMLRVALKVGWGEEVSARHEGGVERGAASRVRAVALDLALNPLAVRCIANHRCKHYKFLVATH